MRLLSFLILFSSMVALAGPKVGLEFCIATLKSYSHLQPHSRDNATFTQYPNPIEIIFRRSGSQITLEMISVLGGDDNSFEIPEEIIGRAAKVTVGGAKPEGYYRATVRVSDEQKVYFLQSGEIFEEALIFKRHLRRDFRGSARADTENGAE